MWKISLNDPQKYLLKKIFFRIQDLDIPLFWSASYIISENKYKNFCVGITTEPIKKPCIQLYNLFSFLLAKVRKPWQSGQYTVYLWEFLFGLLQDPECCSLITWTNKESKEFRINNAHEVATLWGTVKNRPTMNDKKLLRALRYYYKTKVLRKVGLRKNIYNCIYFPIDRSRKDWINYNLYSPCNKSTLPYLTCLPLFQRSLIYIA